MPPPGPARRVMHISPAALKLKGGAFMHNVGAKLTNGLIRLGHHVVHVSDRDLARQLSPLGSRKLGKFQANRFLPKLIKAVGPELLLLGHADVLEPATLQKIRAQNPDMAVAQWNVDPLFEEGNVRRIREKIALCDATFVTTAGPMLDALRAPGRIVGYMPNPVDPSIERHRNFARDDFKYDLFCLVHGTMIARQIGRDFLSLDALHVKLAADVPQLRPGFSVPKEVNGIGFMIGAPYDAALGASRMGLNLSRRNDVYLYSSDRMAHYAGNGLLTWVDRASGFADLFAEDELAFYGSYDELAAQLKAFLADDARRKAVAQRGWARYHALFDGARVAHFMLGALGLMPPLEGCEWRSTLKAQPVATGVSLRAPHSAHEPS